MIPRKTGKKIEQPSSWLVKAGIVEAGPRNLRQFLQRPPRPPCSCSVLFFRRSSPSSPGSHFALHRPRFPSPLPQFHLISSQGSCSLHAAAGPVQLPCISQQPILYFVLEGRTLCEFQLQWSR